MKQIKDGAIKSGHDSISVGTQIECGIAQDQTGNIWFGADNGLVTYHQGAVVSYSTANGLPDDHVNSLIVDKEGSLWVGTTRGLARTTITDRVNFTIAGELSSNLVLSVFEDREGSLWLEASLAD